MSVKHVRFSQDVYCPPTPSPTYSATSLPSSYGPLTPPQSMYTAYLPFAGAGPAPVAMYPALICTGPKHGFHFDVSLPAGNVKLPAAMLNEYATSPPLPALAVVHPRLPWELVIRPAQGKWVRVRDVLAGIYDALRAPATAAEFDLLPSRAAQGEVTAAFARRWMRMPDLGAQTVEKNKGLKRVDFLGSPVVFCGLRPTSQGWEMVIV